MRVGRDGPRLSATGLRWPASRAAIDAAAGAGIDWVLADTPAAPAAGDVPPSWVVVLVGDPAGARAALRRLGRDAIDVLVARGRGEWPAVVELAAAGVARCAGVATDDPRVVEWCRRRRHVDVVLASPRAVARGGPLAEVCRWSGTGLLAYAPSVGRR